MNHCIPDWNFEADPPVTTNHKKPLGSGNELVELLWRNGQVVLHSQTHRKPSVNHNESRQVYKHDQPTLRSGSGSYGNSSHVIQDDETVSWIQYPLEDSFDKEFCSNFLSELPSSDPMETDKTIRQFDDEKFVKFGAFGDAQVITNSQPPNIDNSVVPEFTPRFQYPESTQQNKSLGEFGKVVNSSQFSATLKGNLRSSNGQFGAKGSANLTQGEAKECSVMTVGSSHCGSNQPLNDLDFSRASSNGIGTTTGLSAGPSKEDSQKMTSQSERGKTETLEPTVTSSSGGSGSSFGRTCKQSTGVSNHKRKSRDAEESESQSEAAEFESAVGNKATQRSGSARRTRAAEVHNLSERRRRDRINEKMRALQELIPHCNKTDKASMLDEAIEYLKSLQLQLQVMWMGSGMTPMMFPGVQHYMSRMGMGMGPPALASIHNPMHLSRIPLVDQSISMAPAQNQAVMCQPPVLNPVNYQNQMQNPNFSDQYARYMGFHSMQTSSQPVNMFRFGSQTMQQSQMMAPPASSSVPFNGAAATSNAPPSGKTG